ncbi:hypothetical protein RQP46_002690 [Phenoliferia psychrophenolica]
MPSAWIVHGRKDLDSCPFDCEKCLARLEYDDVGPMIWDSDYDAKQLDCIKCGKTYRWTRDNRYWEKYLILNIEVLETRLARPTRDSAIKLACAECRKSLVYWEPTSRFIADDDTLKVVCEYCEESTPVKHFSSKKERVKQSYIHTLPTELLLNIFSYLVIDKFGWPVPGFPHDLYHLALVCSYWRTPAQDALFSTVFLRSNRQAGVWLAAPLELQALVKHLGIEGNVALGVGSAVIERCNEVEWTDVPRSGLPHPIRSLAIEMPSEFPEDPDDLENLKNLERLFISHLDNEHSNPSIWAVLLYPCSDSLKVLHLISSEFDDADASEEILAEFAVFRLPNLVELVLHDFAPAPLHPLLSSYPHLISLTWNGDITADQFTQDDKDRLQPLLSHLTLGREMGHWRDRDSRSDTNFKEVVKAIALPIFRELEVLTFQRPASTVANWRGEDLLALLEECERRGIYVRCGPNHMWVSSFPERLSCS